MLTTNVRLTHDHQTDANSTTNSASVPAVGSSWSPPASCPTSATKMRSKNSSIQCARDGSRSVALASVPASMPSPIALWGA
jgi:hypothetical protein